MSKVDYRGTIQQRLEAGTLTMPNGCREWQRATSRGYGQISYGGKMVSVHTLTWQLTNGPIPDGQDVLHHCDNPPCRQTEPTEGYPEGHLFLGTHGDNMQDRATKGRDNSANGAKTHCPDNHEYTPANTHIDAAGSRSCKQCRANRVRAWRATHTTD